MSRKSRSLLLLLLLSLGFFPTDAEAGVRRHCAVAITLATGVWFSIASRSDQLTRPTELMFVPGGGPSFPLSPDLQVLLAALKTAVDEGRCLETVPENAVEPITILDDTWGSWAASAIKSSLEERSVEVAQLRGWRQAGVPVPFEKILLRPNPERPDEVFLGVSGVYWTAWSKSSIPVMTLLSDTSLPVEFLFVDQNESGTVQVKVNGRVRPQGNGRVEFLGGKGVLKATSSWGVVATDTFELPDVRLDLFKAQ